MKILQIEFDKNVKQYLVSQDITKLEVQSLIILVGILEDFEHFVTHQINDLRNKEVKKES